MASTDRTQRLATPSRGARNATLSPRGDSWPSWRAGSPNRSARATAGGWATSGAASRPLCRPQPAAPAVSHRAAKAPAKSLVALVPTPKPYRPVIPRPTDTADKEFTFAAWLGRGAPRVRLTGVLTP